MSLIGIITQDTPNVTQSVVFSQSGTTLDSITYTTSGLTYPITSSFVLTLNDFNLFILYKSQFFNSLFSNYPILNAAYTKEVNVNQVKIYSSNGPNIIQFYQSSTASPINLVYNVTFDRNALTATFGARSSAITISIQEYLMAYQILLLYARQVAILGN
jgi:hypothetical protein